MHEILAHLLQHCSDDTGVDDRYLDGDQQLFVHLKPKFGNAFNHAPDSLAETAKRRAQYLVSAAFSSRWLYNKHVSCFLYCVCMLEEQEEV